MIRVMFVCHGNICRSTMAESVLTNMVKERGIEDEFIIASSATSTEEIGNDPHYGTVNKLQEKNIDLVPHKAVQLKKSDYENYDYFIGMDEANINDMVRILGNDEKVFSLLSFAGIYINIADPWYTNDFDRTFQDIVRGCEGFLDYLGF